MEKTLDGTDLTTKQSTVLVDMVEGKKLDSPNDVTTHRNGTIYFSNATYELGGRPAGAGRAPVTGSIGVRVTSYSSSLSSCQPSSRSRWSK